MLWFSSLERKSGKLLATTWRWIVRFNSSVRRDDFRELARVAPGCSSATVDSLVERLRELLEASGLESSLSQLEIDEAELTDLSREAARQWTARFNPRRVEEEQFMEMYRAAYY